MFGKPKPVESEGAKAQRLAQAQEYLAKRKRKIDALTAVNRLFQQALLGPVRTTPDEPATDDRASTEGVSSSPAVRRADITGAEAGSTVQ